MQATPYPDSDFSPIEDDYTPGQYADDKLEHMASDTLDMLLKKQKWRINRLYKIKDKQGKVVTFRMNKAQETLFDNMHYKNIILKARQLGFTTFIGIYILDCALFNSTINCGIIAHHMDDAKVIFDEKIKFPYDNLDPIIKDSRPAKTDRAGAIEFSNGSKIRVSTSFRSGTLNILHVSEYGKLAAKYPDRAIEIKTGAFEAVAADQMVFVESTAEGREGEFYDMTMTAKKLKDGKKTLSLLDFKFFFFPWWQNPEYVLDPEDILITTEDDNYFRDLEGQNITLNDDQKAWWVKKYATMGDLMFREHPSYPEEAFKASIQGAYYGRTVTDLRRKGQIGNVPYEPGYPVYTFWDLGMDDSMSIWFCQFVGREKRLIDYYEHGGEGLAHYANVLREKGYVYGTHFMPHDANVRELGTGKTRHAVASELGINPINVVPRPKSTDQLLDHIEETRSFLSTCWIDETRCNRGIVCLENYRKEWDDKMGAFRRTPLHNWASHGADSLRTGAVGYIPMERYGEEELDPAPLPDW